MVKDESKTDERIEAAAKFLGISVRELKREIKEALIRQVANELAAESLKEWKVTGISRSRPTASDQFPSIEGKAEDEDAPLSSRK